MDFGRVIKNWLMKFWRNKKKLGVSLVLVVIAVVVTYYSGVYSQNAPSAVVNDMILDSIPPINLNFFFVYFFFGVLFFSYFFCLFVDTERVYCYAGMFALLAIFRAGFIVLTHLQGLPDRIIPNFSHIFGFFVFTNDLFFSGHTAIPFMGFLVYRQKWVKVFLLCSSIILAVTVLLEHAHYSIDVFAAYFITYGIYTIGNKIFESRAFQKLD